MKPFAMSLLIGMVAVAFAGVPSSARATDTCLTGTDPVVAADLDQINTLRSHIEQACPCASFDGTRGKRRANYRACARGVLQDEIAAGHLRPACRATVRRDYRTTTCGLPSSRNAVPCIRMTANGVACSIRGADVCPGASCPTHTSCIDAGDSNRNGRLDSDDAIPCAPPLASLSVSPLTLNPPFSPEIHDYAVLCAAGTNALTIDMAAVAGGVVSMSGPVSTPAAQSDSVSVSLAEDQAVVVQAFDPVGRADEYWIRCLPHDFPLLSPTPHPEAGSPSPGWYLLSNAIAPPAFGRFALIVDAHGTPLWYHRIPAPASADIVEPLPDSTIGIVSGAFPNPGTGTLYHLNTWTTTDVLTALPLDIHELLLLPNGNFMVLSYPLRSGVDLTGLQGASGLDVFDYTCTDCTIIDCAVQEVDPQGNLVWDWRAYDHIDPLSETTGSGGAGTVASPADVFHCNSIDADADGNVLVSFRECNAVYQISKATGQVTWKLGGTPSNKDGAQILTIADDPFAGFSGQHDARYRPNGNISLFDDRSFFPMTPVSGPARGVEYSLDLSAGTASLVWQFQAASNSGATGSFRRYDDGSNVIGWGFYFGTENLAFSDVDDAGQDRLDMVWQSRGNWTYRVLKVPVGTYDIGVLRSTAGLP